MSQDNPDAGFDVSGRVAEIFLESKKLGRFGLGRGFASAWVAPEVDLSGTQFASLLPVGNLFPGLKFVDSETKKITDIQIRNHFADLERFFNRGPFPLRLAVLPQSSVGGQAITHLRARV